MGKCRFHCDWAGRVIAGVIATRLHRNSLNVGELRQDDFPQSPTQGTVPFQGHALGEVGAYPDDPLVNVRQELDAQPWGDAEADPADKGQSCGEHQPAAGQQSTQTQRVEPHRRSQQRVFPLAVTSPVQLQTNDRHHEKREHQCTKQSIYHRQRHGTEQQTFDAGQRQQRDIRGYDNRQGEKYRTFHL